VIQPVGLHFQVRTFNTADKQEKGEDPHKEPQQPPRGDFEQPSV
jgi:hypothetical protein